MGDSALLSLDEIWEELPVFYTAAIKPNGPSYHFKSGPGMGKTSLLNRFPERMEMVDPSNKYAMSYLNGASITVPWLAGFMQLVSALHDGTLASNGHNEQLMKSVFSLPFWWFLKNGNPISAYNGGFVFIDEYDKMDLDCKKIAADMRLNRCVANHYLPEDWVVFTAGNRPGIDRSGSTKEFAFERNRRQDVEVRPDAHGWSEHMRKHSNMLPETIEFGVNHSDLLYQKMPDKDGEAWCTPRSLDQADMYVRSHMEVWGKTKIPLDPKVQGVVTGGIGREAAEQLFVDYKMGQELPEYLDAVADPDNIEIPDSMDRLRLFSYKMADAAQPKDAGALVRLMKRMPNEFQVMLMKMAMDRNKMIMVRPEMRDWARTHMHLVAVVDNFAQRHAS